MQRSITRIVFSNRKKAAAKQRRQWRRLLAIGKRNLGIPDIRKIRV